MGPTVPEDHAMRRLAAAVFALALIAPAIASAAPLRIRGTIAEVTGNTLVVRTTAGPMQRIRLGAKTIFHRMTRSSLSRVAPGSYIGTAAKSVDGKLVALEVLVFPPAMRGVGEGHYPWDQLPNPSRPGQSVTTTMTNGTVSAAAPATVATSMTNGTVAAAAKDAGGKRITVTYKGGTQSVLVPPGTPIVTLLPGSRAELKPGAPVFAVAKQAGKTLTALSVSVGIDGVRPPM